MEVTTVEDPSFYQISLNVKLRKGAKSGLWCGFLLPMALITSCYHFNETPASASYKMTSLCSLVSSVYINLHLFNWKPLNIHIVSAVITLAGCFFLSVLDGVMGLLCLTSVIILLNIKSYSLLEYVLKTFPFSFSIGEAVVVVEGTIILVFSTLVNLFLANNSSNATLFSQILLFGLGIFFVVTSLSSKVQKLVPFVVILVTVMGLFTLPIMFQALGKNPVIWIFVDLIFSSQTRIFLILYWVACTISALLIVWFLGRSTSEAPVNLTVIRKCFHGVVVAIYLPGIFCDPELLFVASTIALTAFLLLEAIRFYDLEYIGPFLSQGVAGFLDEKDQGTLILTHIYLLVGCSLPIWIAPFRIASNASQLLILSAGVISLGVGDTAASVCGTIWGKTKLPNSSKSVEGTVCSILAEISFIALLYSFGLFGATSSFPWLRIFVAAISASLVEAFTTQVDNLVLPLVMFITLSA